MQTLKAIVFPEANKVEIQEFPLPELRSGELLVKTELSGVSQGTELWALTARRPELGFPTCANAVRRPGDFRRGFSLVSSRTELG